MQGRELVFEHAYDDACEKYGGIQRFDDVLRGVYWALATNPYCYDVVVGMKETRLMLTRQLDGTPGFRIWFRVASDDKVHLLMLEPLSHPEDNSE